MTDDSPSAPTVPGETLTEEFAFDVVTVDATGEIIERQPSTATQFIEDLGGGASLAMVAIPGGRFLMGSRAGEGYDDERPQHSVSIPSFLLGKHPVTLAEWAAVMGRLPPCRGRREQQPVDRISWDAAQSFCRKLAAKTGRPYRLPSEAEWEFACRAESTTPFYCGVTITTDLANYVGDYVYRAEPRGVYRHGSTDVGSFPPNAFGLYDMHGNVWEWCADAWHVNYAGAPNDGRAWQGETGSERVLRGGCWHDPPTLCRSAARLKSEPHEGEDYFGLRVALTTIERPAAAQWRRRQG